MHVRRRISLMYRIDILSKGYDDAVRVILTRVVSAERWIRYVHVRSKSKISKPCAEYCKGYDDAVRVILTQVIIDA